MTNYKLIVTICNHGYADDIMSVAKKAGARGGTVMRGRSTAIHEETKFFGITIHPEKDLILIVTTKDGCVPIMDAINKAHGVGKEAHALSFSLPIDDAIGFNF